MERKNRVPDSRLLLQGTKLCLIHLGKEKGEERE